MSRTVGCAEVDVAGFVPPVVVVTTPVSPEPLPAPAGRCGTGGFPHPTRTTAKISERTRAYTARYDVVSGFATTGAVQRLLHTVPCA